jgi:hypothetical protein
LAFGTSKAAKPNGIRSCTGVAEYCVGMSDVRMLHGTLEANIATAGSNTIASHRRLKKLRAETAMDESARLADC